MNINTSAVKINSDRRIVDSSKVEQLADSIKEIGLINPITARECNGGYLLIAGMHRLEAFKLLGKETIEANIVTGTELEFELMEIDENLMRNELHYSEIDELTYRRKQIYEEMYPETKVGQSQAISMNKKLDNNVRTDSGSTSKPSFITDTSNKTGKSETVLKESIKRARDLTPEIKEMLKEESITKTEATIISRQEPAQQKEVIEEIIESKKPHVSNNSGNNEWYTPPEYIEIARNVMGSIDCDPASSDIANKTVKADTFHTTESNGLKNEWLGNVWMNPPYAQPLMSLFAEKLVEQLEVGNVKQACVLVNNATETKWFQTMSEKAQAIWFIKSRVKFLDVNGNPGGAPLQGQCVLYFGDNVEEFINQCDGLVCRCCNGQ